MGGSGGVWGLRSCEPKALAKVEIVIEKVSTPSRLTYKALIGGREVHRSLVRSFRLRIVNRSREYRQDGK